MSGTVTREIDGSMGFGSIGAVVINRLMPTKEYGFVVKHECDAFPQKYSYNKYALATTLQTGTYAFLRMTI